ncbi:MAG: 16S rRNA (adenine(1518)-N(6)/adenine(1519)-N(6))-dimethyltransferase RsmA [Peptostreptococcales bacterium]
MDKLYAPRTINDIMKKHDFKTSKRYGQNFLTDGNIVRKIVDAAATTKDDLIIEIGPGIGTLTAELAKEAGKVLAIEIDKRLIPILNENLKEFENIRIMNIDFLLADIEKIIKEEKPIGDVKIIGNLPYYITTPIIMKILEEKIKVKSITIMVQKEVADRLKAHPGTKEYGAISVAVQYYADIKMISQVSREVFLPKPHVDSAVIRLDIRKKPAVEVENEELFFQLVKAGFNQRRKTLLNALSQLSSFNKVALEKTLIKCEIDPKRRAETLSLEEFALLERALSQGF